MGNCLIPKPDCAPLPTAGGALLLLLLRRRSGDGQGARQPHYAVRVGVLQRSSFQQMMDEILQVLGSFTFDDFFLLSVLIDSHQFKVSNGDSSFRERLKLCDVNYKLILNRVLMLGSQAQTIIGRPTLIDAAVHAVVEEHVNSMK
ncbi:hypothetical protein ACQ4PT_000919 [Festuca glaucescens]